MNLYITMYVRRDRYDEDKVPTGEMYTEIRHVTVTEDDIEEICKREMKDDDEFDSITIDDIKM